MTDIRWLLLDVGGVLEIVDDASWPAQFDARWEGRLGLQPGEFRSRLARADLPDAARLSGVIHEYWRLTAEALGASPSQRAEMEADFWDAYCGRRNDALMDFLDDRRGEVGMALLSNSGDGARAEEERRYGFSTRFAPILYSHEIGVLKPDPEAFRIALAAMDADADEVFFVDDAAHNVDAARDLGIRAFLHVDTESTIAAIEQALSPRD